MPDGQDVILPNKAAGVDFLGRFREIVSDPLNLLIPRHPLAGVAEGDHVILHNGNRVAYRGPLAYYEGFSTILVINRGVHEPLEEYAFHAVLQHLDKAPTMIELGAYWGHYSMWLKRARPEADIHLLEPFEHNLNVGKSNCALNGFDGFILASNAELPTVFDGIKPLGRVEILLANPATLVENVTSSLNALNAP